MRSCITSHRYHRAPLPPLPSSLLLLLLLPPDFPPTCALPWQRGAVPASKEGVPCANGASDHPIHLSDSTSLSSHASTRNPRKNGIDNARCPPAPTFIPGSLVPARRWNTPSCSESSSQSGTDSLTWISWYCSLPGHECECWGTRVAVCLLFLDRLLLWGIGRSWVPCPCDPNLLTRTSIAALSVMDLGNRHSVMFPPWHSNVPQSLQR